MNSFDQKKTLILREILENSENSPDASPKGTIDVLCLPLIETINAHEDMVTTSLCSGRVLVFLEGKKNNSQIGAKGNDGRWLFVAHDPKDLDGWQKNIDFVFSHASEIDLSGIRDNSRYILFKFEPLILHVKCRDAASANLLYSTAMACGFRESGIGSNHIVGIRILIKLDVPIGYLHDDQRLMLMVSRDYLEILTSLSLDRFRENFRKMDQLDKAIQSMKRVEKKPEETKEERRLRKINEGMARRDAVRAEKEQKRKEKLLAEGEAHN